MSPTPSVDTTGIGTCVAVGVEQLFVDLGGVEVLRGVDLAARSGRWTTVIGPNGAGKTTLLRAVAGLAKVTSGAIEVNGAPLDRLNVRERARQIAVMPQNPVVPPRMRVVDYVLLGRSAHQGYGLRATVEDLELIEHTLSSLDLDGFASRRVDELSGGERQRVIVARAIAQQAKILLLDEPTTALDIGHQQEVLEMVDTLRREHDLTILASFHDLSLAAQYSHHLVLLVAGEVLAAGEPIDVLDEDLLSSVYRADLEVAQTDGEIIVTPRRRRRRS